MKINEAEQLLGITKANIRFYEKEGLLTPSRNENGYRDYSEADIRQLKQIVILRKLGIPVQQIGDILDGALPLQDALEENIASLNAQIDALNGALAMTKQLWQENQETLDTDRCWEMIQHQESQGFHFHQLVEDYLKFTEVNYEWLLWPIPAHELRNPWTVVKFILGINIFGALLQIPLGNPFLPTFLQNVLRSICSLALWTAIFIPVYLLRRRKPRLAKGIMIFLLAGIPVIGLLIVFSVILSQGIHP